MPKKQDEAQSELQVLLQNQAFIAYPKAGDTIKGTVISSSRREVKIDIQGIATGVVRGRELFGESKEYANLQPGDEVETTVIDLENENGEMELSFRFAGQKKAWDELKQLFAQGKPVMVKILEANKGGLIVKLQNTIGFLPVSQLAPEHYPRVTGGDKHKILERIKEFVGSEIEVRILDLNENENKLILSEKALWEEKQKNVIEKYKVGDIIEGEVTALADFGAFVRFDGLEGLIHISEIAWQRIDHPRDILKAGQTVKAEIIGLEGSKIFLSMKKLVDDPWKDVEKKYKIGDKVEGLIIKSNPFGFFVELDHDIHGLAHMSELSDKPIKDLSEIAAIGDKKTFTVITIEPQEHRLGLSLKSEPFAKAPETAKEA
ncbi:MAG: RNA binding S1 protein [uncultured bacterium]|nr:MAG: RNA binding S1 protein [uncultured bacterium]HBD05477.1 30S ribosomal protein S1 [Candidatus Uhrbacteria bacterium]